METNTTQNEKYFIPFDETIAPPTQHLAFDLLQAQIDSRAQLQPNIKNIKVGIIDSGICEHLRTKLATKYSIHDWEENILMEETKYDHHGHGTHIFGIIHQMVPNCHFYIAKVLDEVGRVYLEKVISALKWLREVAQVHAINMSLLFREIPLHLQSGFILELEKCKTNGIAIFTALGNTSINQRLISDYMQSKYPQNNPQSDTFISKQWEKQGLLYLIGSYDVFEQRESLFSFGDCKYYAPGNNVISYLSKKESFCFRHEKLSNDLASCSGTSQATAIVTGWYLQRLWNGCNKAVDIEKAKVMLDKNNQANIFHHWLNLRNISSDYFVGKNENEKIEQLLFLDAKILKKSLNNQQCKAILELRQELNYRTLSNNNNNFVSSPPISSLPFGELPQSLLFFGAVSKVVPDKTLIEYFDEKQNVYCGIYFLDILQGFLIQDINAGQKTLISSVSLRILSKYWRDVGGSDFTRVPGAVNQETVLKREMEELYPFGTKSKATFFKDLVLLVIKQYPRLSHEKNFEKLKKFCEKVYINEFQTFDDITIVMKTLNLLF